MFKDKTFKYFTTNPPGKSAGGMRPHYPETREANERRDPRGPGAPGSALSQPRPLSSSRGAAAAGGGRGPHESNTVPAPKNRVRVPGNAGDKCVVPVKSRPKKRKSVKGTEENCLSIDNVEWSDNPYTVNQLVREFGERFPVIVKVNQGFYGSCGDLSRQQVLQIHSYGKQKRVMATDAHGRKISLPADYPMDVYIRSGDGGERSRFQSALDLHRLPLKAKVVNIDEDPEFENNSYTVDGEEMTFTSVEEAFFLRANSINDGWVDQLDIYIIPSFLGAEFSVAIGMRTATRDEWEDYNGMFSRSVRHLNYRMLTGYKGIVVDGHLPSSARTSNVSTAPGALGRESVSEPQSPTSPGAGLAPGQGQVYENLPESASRRAMSQSSSGPSSPAQHTSSVSPPHMTPANSGRPNDSPSPCGLSPQPDSSHQQTNFHFGIRSDQEAASGGDASHLRPDLDPQHHGRSRTPSPGGAEDENVEEMFASVLSVAMEEEERRERDSLRRPKEGASFDNPAFIDSNSNEVERGTTPPHYRTPTNYRPQDSLRPEGGRPEAGRPEAGPPKAVVQPRVQNSAKDPNKFVVTVTIEDSLDRRKPANQSKTGHQQPNTYENLNNSHLNGNYGDGNVDNRPPPKINTSTSSNINGMEDVPTIIDALTVEDICKCLALLNMESHVPEFKKKQVDGNLLSNLKENVLVSEFRLTPFNASKLMRFIRGWRPKFT